MGFFLVLNWTPDTFFEVLVIYTYLAFCELGYFPALGLQAKQNKHSFSCTQT